MPQETELYLHGGCMASSCMEVYMHFCVYIGLDECFNLSYLEWKDKTAPSFDTQ